MPVEAIIDLSILHGKIHASLRGDTVISIAESSRRSYFAADDNRSNQQLDSRGHSQVCKLHAGARILLINEFEAYSRLREREREREREKGLK